MALYTIPVQKSTFGYSFRLVKYSSASASFSKLIARSSNGLVSLSWMVSRTVQHIFCMMVALGSKFLYTRCPKPMRRKLEFLSLERSMMSLMETPSFNISYNILRTASLAPPWQGPQREPIPAAMQAKGLACELPAMRTVEVDAFCSCSAWQIQMTSSARKISQSISKVSLMGLENIMQRKFFMYEKFLRGQTMGRPIAVRQAQAARVGILAISFMAISCLSRGLKRSQSEWRKAERAPTTPTMMAMGCASLLNPLQNSIIFSLIIISPLTTCSNLLSSLLEGRVPQSRRQQVSIQEECSARSQMRQPRQSSSPFSPLMQQMLEMQLAVHMKPGSQVSRLACDSSERTSIRSWPREPRRMGSSYYLSPTFKIAFCYQCFGQMGLTRVRSSLSFISIYLNQLYPLTLFQTIKHQYTKQIDISIVAISFVKSWIRTVSKSTQSCFILDQVYVYSELVYTYQSIIVLFFSKLKQFSLPSFSNSTNLGRRYFSQYLLIPVCTPTTKMMQATRYTQHMRETQSRGLQTGVAHKLQPQQHIFYSRSPPDTVFPQGW